MNKKRKLKAQLQELFDNSKGVMELEIVKTPEHLPQLVLAVCGHDPNARRTIILIDNWLTVLNKAKPGTAALCGQCPHEFSSVSLPAAMIVVTPFAGTMPKGVVMGVCETCCKQVGWDNMPDLALKLWRNISPHAYVTPIGDA